MQSKGWIRLVAILLAIASIWQLSFTAVTALQERKANKFAEKAAQAAMNAASFAKVTPENQAYYLDSIRNLYCIGRNGQHRYNNMDHSMLTAFAAVEHILSGKDSDRSKIWTVNTEKEYHEEQRRQGGH